MDWYVGWYFFFFALHEVPVAERADGSWNVAYAVQANAWALAWGCINLSSRSSLICKEVPYLRHQWLPPSDYLFTWGSDMCTMNNNRRIRYKESYMKEGWKAPSRGLPRRPQSELVQEPCPALSASRVVLPSGVCSHQVLIAAMLVFSSNAKVPF